MQKIFLTALFSMALLSLNACNDDKETKTPSAKKCDAGKCSGDTKQKATETKCSSENKCGEGKCG